MTALWQQAVDSIITHTAEVIEGSASYGGIPGVHSHDELLRGASPSNLTITATGGTTTTVIDTTRTYADDRWVKVRAPPFWLLCATATETANVGAARKISAWVQGTTTFTVAAFTATVTAADTFYMLEGFRHVVDGAGEDSAQDRRFVVDLEPGDAIDSYGAGSRSITGKLVVTLTLEKAGKHVSARQSAMVNGEILRNALLDKDNWEATYTRAVIPEGSSVVAEDTEAGAVQVVITIPIVYKVSLTME